MKTFRAVLFDAILFAVAYFAFIKSSVLAQNIVYFISILAGFTGFILYVTSAVPINDSERAKWGTPHPKWWKAYDALTDIAFMLILASQAWFFCAAFIAIFYSGKQVAYATIRRAKNNIEEKAI